MNAVIHIYLIACFIFFFLIVSVFLYGCCSKDNETPEEEMIEAKEVKEVIEAAEMKKNCNSSSSYSKKL